MPGIEISAVTLYKKGARIFGNYLLCIGACAVVRQNPISKMGSVVEVLVFRGKSHGIHEGDLAMGSLKDRLSEICC